MLEWECNVFKPIQERQTSKSVSLHKKKDWFVVSNWEEGRGRKERVTHMSHRTRERDYHQLWFVNLHISVIRSKEGVDIGLRSCIVRTCETSKWSHEIMGSILRKLLIKAICCVVYNFVSIATAESWRIFLTSIVRWRLDTSFAIHFIWIMEISKDI